MEIEVESHGIIFIRSGECSQCGACGCDKEPCIHHGKHGGLSYCAIYEIREEFCVDCGTDHASCIGFPDNPWIHVVRSGQCAFTFRRADGGLMDALPFLDGQPYRTG